MTLVLSVNFIGPGSFTKAIYAQYDKQQSQSWPLENFMFIFLHFEKKKILNIIGRCDLNFMFLSVR